MPIQIYENILLAPYTTFKIGGPARFFVEVKNFDEIKEALVFAKEKGLLFFILGAGSNLLVSDKGYKGLTIRLAKGSVMADGLKLIATADVTTAQLVLKSQEASLTGLEWAIGIPGTIGGSVRGNAGCFGGEIKDVMESVRFIEFPSIDFKELKNQECEFSYRESIFKKHPEWIIVSVTLVLKKGDPKKNQEITKRIITERVEKQDIGVQSAGCIFKNISWERKDINREKLLKDFEELKIFQNKQNISAGFLIDKTGLKGERIGQAQISEKHANFFINLGNATAEEIRKLILIAKDAVKKKYGLLIEEEIEYVGF